MLSFFYAHWLNTCMSVSQIGGNTVIALPEVENVEVNLEELGVFSALATKIDGARQLRFSGDLDLQSNKIVNLTDPTSDQDAATKKYVDDNSGTGGGGGGGMAIGDTVTGGTTGSVLFIGNSSSLQQDNGNLFWSDSSDRLGIGTSSPAAQLHISGSDTTGAAPSGAHILIEDNTASAKLVLKTNDASSCEILFSDSGNGGSISYDHSSGFMRFTAEGTSICEIENDGTSVGINMLSKDISNIKTDSYATEFDDGNSGFNKTINWNNGSKHRITLNANATLSFTDPPGPADLTLKIIQDGTGSRTITWNGNQKSPNGSISLSSASGAVDLARIYFDGSDYFMAVDNNFLDV